MRQKIKNLSLRVLRRLGLEPVLEPESATEPVSVFDKEALLSPREVLDMLVGEAKSIITKMQEWVPTPQQLEEVHALIPDDDASDKLAEALLTIQKKYLKQQFFGPMITMLENTKDDVYAFSPQDRFNHQLQVGVIVSQLVQIMAVATQSLVALALAHHSKKEKHEKKPAKEPSDIEWSSWGTAVGEA